MAKTKQMKVILIVTALIDTDIAPLYFSLLCNHWL